MHAPTPWPSHYHTILAAWQEQIGKAARTPWLLQHFVQHGTDLLPRCLGYYTHLQRLPRRVRRALQRKLARSLTGVALLLALGQGQALAASIMVDGTTCTLVNAITTANSNTNTGGCVLVGTAGADTLVLEPGSLHTLTTAIDTNTGPAGLPRITSDITIQGNGSTITRSTAPGTPNFRILVVGTGQLDTTAFLTLYDTTVSGGLAMGHPINTENSGGGIFNHGGTVTVINSTIAGNSASDSGGGIRTVSNGVLTLTNCTISGNSSGYQGGGIIADSFFLSVMVTNNTISGNTALYGGGVVNSSGGGTSFTFINSTITNNVATDQVGGVLSGAPVTFQHTIVSGNTAVNSPQSREVKAFPPTFTAEDFNLFGINGNAGVASSYSDLPIPLDTTDSDMDGKVDIVPAAGVMTDDILAPLTLNVPGTTRTHALVDGSPAVDAVLSGTCPATDQRGVTRPVDGDGDTVARCDIGAFELAPPIPPELAHDLAVTDISVPKIVTLTDAKPTQIKTVKVQIQNRSAHTETIPDMTVLTELVSLDLTSLGACPEPTKALVPPTKFPVLLKSKQKLNVAFDVTFNCPNDPARNTAKDLGHEDYVYTATVDHSALPGTVADDHPADDNCPRDPLGTDPNPDGKIKDKGCGEEVTDVVVK